MITAIERHIDCGLGLAFPVLVVVSDLLPLATLAFAPLSAWLAIAAVALLAVAACAYLLRARGVGVALGLSVAGVLGGAGLFALVMMGLRAVGDSDGAVQDAANTLVMVFSLMLVALAQLAVALSFRHCRRIESHWPSRGRSLSRPPSCWPTPSAIFRSEPAMP